ncbi:MAG: AMMECR1 domain-containing protein [Crenarchaeota archaeon]|nr:AMMECR1 domain-containing protein [Thermoproteota archaeon]
MIFRPFTLNEARHILRLCRQLINNALSGKEEEDITYILPQELREKLENTNYGVFVTIEKIISSSMDGVYKRVVRGSVGALPSDDYATLDLLKLVAPGAATKDPRRTPLHKNELGSCVIEVMFVFPEGSVMTDDLHEILIPGYHVLAFDVDNCKRIIMPHEIIEIAENLLKDSDKSIGVDELISAIVSKYEISRRTLIQVYGSQIFYEVLPDSEIIERKLYLNRVFRRVVGKHRQLLAHATSLSSKHR